MQGQYEAARRPVCGNELSRWCGEKGVL